MVRMRGGLAVLLLCLCRLSFAQGGGMRYCADCPELVAQCYARDAANSSFDDTVQRLKARL